MLGEQRRPLTPAPTLGPLAAPGGREAHRPSGDAAINIGQGVAMVETGRGAPPLPPSPAPFKPSRFHIPAMYVNPNHYGFPLHDDAKDRERRVPLASIPAGQQIADQPRVDWQRPTTAGPESRLIA